jgi:UPF0271 protein
MHVVDLNADVGEWESFPNADVGLMPFLSSANISCGAHAGNAEVIARTVALALRHQVAIGAHPGFDDRLGFGRRELVVDRVELIDSLETQIVRLKEVAERQGGRLTHVKPHGALYNMAARDRAIADTIASVVARIDPSLALIGLSGSELVRAGARALLATMSETFADLAYQADGTLAPRSTEGAVLKLRLTRASAERQTPRRCLPCSNSQDCASNAATPAFCAGSTGGIAPGGLISF